MSVHVILQVVNSYTSLCLVLPLSRITPHARTTPRPIYAYICTTIIINSAWCCRTPHSLYLMGRTRYTSRFLLLPHHVFLTGFAVHTSLSRSLSIRTQPLVNVYMSTCLHMYMYDTCSSLLRNPSCQFKLVRSTTSEGCGTHVCPGLRCSDNGRLNKILVHLMQTSCNKFTRLCPGRATVRINNIQR